MGWPGSLRVLSHWPLNDALKSYLPFRMPKILKVRPWRCGGGKEDDEEGGETKFL